MGVVVKILTLILGLLGWKKSPQADPKVQLGQEQVKAQVQEQARGQAENIVRADRDAGLERVRDTPSVSTPDPDAPVNADDGFRVD